MEYKTGFYDTHIFKFYKRFGNIHWERMTPQPTVYLRFTEEVADSTIESAPPVNDLEFDKEFSAEAAADNVPVDDFSVTYSNDTFGEDLLRVFDAQETHVNSTLSDSQIISGGASQHHSEFIVTITYVFFALSIASLIQFLIRRFPKCIRPPYAVTLFGIGALFSYLSRKSAHGTWFDLFSESIHLVENINPEVVFFLILPPLLYEEGANLNWHVFRRLMWSAIILAFPGVVLNLFFIGLYAFAAFGPGWTLPISFLLGSMLSTTDPVAVVAALQNLHAPDKLALLIDGESLLNDGSAIVGVLIFQNMIESNSFSFVSIIDLLFRCAIGGCLFGVLFASFEVICLKIVGKFDHSWPTLETSIVVVGMFLCYLVADLLHMSGIIAVVSLAISMAVIGRGSFSPEAEHQVHAVVSQLAHFSNQIIWLAGGHMTAAMLSQSDVATDPVEWIRMFGLYLILNLARALSTWIMYPTLARMGYGLNLKETIMLIYSGLRGAVCIALAMLIRRTDNIDQHTMNQMGFYVAGAVMLTLVVNGSTIELVYRYLKIYPKRTWSQIQMQRALALVNDRSKKYLDSLKNHWFFKSVDFKILIDVLPDFSRAEFSTDSGELHVPMESVESVLKRVMNQYDDVADNTSMIQPSPSDLCDNGFMYAELRTTTTNQSSKKRIGRTDSSSDMSVKNETVDRLIKVVQMSDTKLKSIHSSVEIFESVKTKMVSAIPAKFRSLAKRDYFSLYQSSRPVSGLGSSMIDPDQNPFASFSTSSRKIGQNAIEFTITIPETGIHKSLMGSSPQIVVGVGPWNCQGFPGSVSGSCGLYTEFKELYCEGDLKVGSRLQPTEMKRDFVRGDSITVIVEKQEEENIQVTFNCGRYFVTDCVIKTDSLNKVFPTIGFLVPEEQVDLSFSLRTTTFSETRTESFAYILNAAMCLYEDLFKGGSLRAVSLRTLNDSVQYGIDAANNDLEVVSLRERVKKVRSIYTKDRTKYEDFSSDNESLVESQQNEESHMSPLETEWGFLQLRHMRRIDCNDEGVRGWLLRLGEFFGIRSQYRITYRKMEELLSYAVVHSDLISHVELAKFPDTLELVNRLVHTSRNYLLSEVCVASPRDFYAAQHVLAAKILLNITRKVLESFTKEGSLGPQSVHELESHYITKQLLELNDFAPHRPKNSAWLDAFKLPKQRYPTQVIVSKQSIMQ